MSSIDINLIEEVRRNLAAESPEMIDFDRLAQLLAGIPEWDREFDRMVSELAVLRKDYIQRILGMLKANMASRRDPSDRELAAKLTEESGKIESAELVRLYVRAAARFRDNFPASFGYLDYSRGRISPNWSEHKI